MNSASGISPLTSSGLIPLGVDFFHPGTALPVGLACTFDTSAPVPVSTTVGLGIGITVLRRVICHPLPEDPVGVAPLDARADGQREEVVPVDGQQRVRIAGQVPVVHDREGRGDASVFEQIKLWSIEA